MMHAAFILTALVASAAASPTGLVPARNVFEACEQAVNCQVTRDPATNSSRIGYKRGLGPGTAFFEKHAKRKDGDIETQVTLSDNKVEYGCGDNIDIPSMMDHLSELCKETGSCITKESKTYSQAIDYTTPNKDSLSERPSSLQWVLSAEGEYPSELRNAFVDAVKALSGVGVDEWDQKWHVYVDQHTEWNGQCHLKQQTGEYHVARYVWTNNVKVLQGYVIATATIPDLQKGFCDHIGPFIASGAVAGAIPEVGGVLAGIFGLVVAACNM